MAIKSMLKPAPAWAIVDPAKGILPDSVRRTRSEAIGEYIEGTGMDWAQHKKLGARSTQVWITEMRDEPIAPPKST